MSRKSNLYSVMTHRPSSSLIWAMLRRGIVPLLFLFFSAAASAQFHRAFIFSPPNPQPGDSVSVFIRASDSVNGYVPCYQIGDVITGVSIVGTTITLDLLAAIPPGGFTIEPFCDGNTVSLGVLQAGTYTVTARYVFPGGTVSAVLTSPLLVGVAAAEPAAIPLFGPFGMIASAIMLALVGGWFLRVPSSAGPGKS